MYNNGDFARWRRHPWHGMAAHPGDDKGVVTGFIESLPGDTIKYELDKDSGYLMIDRAQRTTAAPPCLYGFIPRTYWQKMLPRDVPELMRPMATP